MIGLVAFDQCCRPNVAMSSLKIEVARPFAA
jgi:hypothetical protein